MNHTVLEFSFPETMSRTISTVELSERTQRTQSQRHQWKQAAQSTTFMIFICTSIENTLKRRTRLQFSTFNSAIEWQILQIMVTAAGHMTDLSTERTFPNNTTNYKRNSEETMSQVRGWWNWHKNICTERIIEWISVLFLCRNQFNLRGTGIII